MFSLPAPTPWAFFPQLHKAILCYIIDRAGCEKRGADLKATSNCGRIRIQVCSPLFGVRRIHLGIAGKAVPLQDSAISVYRHSCQTLDGEAFRPNGGPV